MGTTILQTQSCWINAKSCLTCAHTATGCSPRTTKKGRNRSRAGSGWLRQVTQTPFVCLLWRYKYHPLLKCLGRVCKLPWDTSLVLPLLPAGLGTLSAPCATAQVPPQRLHIHFLLPAYLPPALECILPYLGDKWPPRRALNSRAIYLPDMCFPVCFLQPWAMAGLWQPQLWHCWRVTRPLHSGLRINALAIFIIYCSKSSLIDAFLFGRAAKPLQAFHKSVWNFKKPGEKMVFNHFSSSNFWFGERGRCGTVPMRKTNKNQNPFLFSSFGWFPVFHLLLLTP